ncbi:N-acetyltransferase [Bacillus luti]|uniref:N-acetyltransferase n=1 Tax=Bacillus luti TaxID=2026191 RepID=UPI003D02AB1D
MNIRLNKKTEVNKLLEIWYEGSVIAHDFIDKDYWKSQRTEMKEKYLPMSETYVISNEEDIVGFVSMVDNYLAALFIDVKHQGEGYGKELLNFIKRQRDNIKLKVYKKNNNAVKFYLGNGFVVKEESLDEQTAEEEFLMVWEKGS